LVRERKDSDIKGGWGGPPHRAPLSGPGLFTTGKREKTTTKANQQDEKKKKVGWKKPTVTGEAGKTKRKGRNQGKRWEGTTRGLRHPPSAQSNDPKDVSRKLSSPIKGGWGTSHDHLINHLW